MEWLVPALAAFACGVLVEYVNSLITKRALSRGGAALIALPVRLLLAGGLIAALFLISKAKEWDPAPLVIGAAVGLTFGLIAFTSRLMTLPFGDDEEKGSDKENG